MVTRGNNGKAKLKEEKSINIDSLPLDLSVFPSIGSMGHHNRACRPCAHVWKAAGCSKGRNCSFCHLCGQKEFKVKISNSRKQARARARTNRSERGGSVVVE